MTSKPFWQSTTLWINFIGLLAIILPIIIQIPEVSQDKDVVAIILAVANILNRFSSAPKTNLTLT